MLKELFRTRFSLFRIFSVFFTVFYFIFFITNLAHASETNGTIDSTYKYAWGENIGWINFGCDNCAVAVTDSAITGKAWSGQFGWINLNPDTSGVTNNAEGTLSGYAWSSNLGWINFTGVTINSSGEFSGYATLKSDSSSINFNCVTGNSCSSADFKVKTDWRPASTRTTTTTGGGGGGGHYIIPPVIPPVIPPATPPPINPIAVVINNIIDFFKPNPTPAVVQIPKVAPISFQTRWNLLPVRAIREFVFAPLPYEVRILAAKFPELNKTLKSVGIDRLSDLSKLSGVTFNLKGLTELEKTIQSVGVDKLNDINKLNGVALKTPVISNAELEKTLETLGVKSISDLDKLKTGQLSVLGMSSSELKKTLQSLGIEKISDLGKLKTVALSVPGLSGLDGKLFGSVGTGKISLIKGLPVAKFPAIAKKNLPTEFVFARTAGELVDLNVAISVGERGQVAQTINLLPANSIKLVVKPISKARSVIGYFIYKSATPKITRTEISRSSLTASALFSVNDLAEKNPEPISIENKLVLSSFEYTDPDHDGIYTADVISPVVPGEYEVITVIDYIDPVLGVRQMRMITVIDPEGYVFEKNGNKETRIPGAIVSLYHLNSSTKNYELWNAEDYHQENPQITDVRGTYSFLVPEGTYYFEVEAPGYDAYEGKVFNVIEGSGVHQNIEMKSSLGLTFNVDWRTLLLIVVLLLLVYNLWRDKLSKLFKRNDGK